MDNGKINLSIDSDLHQVQHVGEAVRCLASHLELADAKPSSVELAVVEAINNSIEHAYQLKAGNSVHVSFEYNSNCLNIKISDYGVPMPKSIVGHLSADIGMPSGAVDLDALPESGWGMQLLKSVCDEVSYNRNDSCNTLSLSFKLASVTA